jgi:hypothetical protein
MSRGSEDEMRTALRQARTIASFESEPSIRRTLGLAHKLYDAMLRMTPEGRSRRVDLIDSIFGCPAAQAPLSLAAPIRRSETRSP